MVTLKPWLGLRTLSSATCAEPQTDLLKEMRHRKRRKTEEGAVEVVSQGILSLKQAFKRDAQGRLCLRVDARMSQEIYFGQDYMTGEWGTECDGWTGFNRLSHLILLSRTFVHV